MTEVFFNVIINCYASRGFFNIPILSADMIEPTNINTKYNNGLETRKITKIAPCGADILIPSPSIAALVITELTTKLTIIRTGFAAANGIAPSVMNDAPSTKFVIPASRSS